MPTYETKPRRVQAQQFRAGRPFPEGVGTGYRDGHPAFYVTTAHHQQAWLEYGDWVLPEPDGRGHYPVKDDIFRERHTPVCTCSVDPTAHGCDHHPDCAFRED